MHSITQPEPIKRVLAYVTEEPPHGSDETITLKLLLPCI